MIRVLITEDSGLVCKLMKTLLESDPNIKVVGWAKNGRECIDKVKVLKPNVITMDIHMPIMDGYEATRTIMQDMPTAILVVSAVVKGDAAIVFKLLKAGALDVIEKPVIQKGMPLNKMGNEVIQKVKAVAKVRPFRKYHHRSEPPAQVHEAEKRPYACFGKPINKRQSGILAIGASTGGPPVLSYILKTLPKNFSLPIVVAQHIFHGFTTGLVSWLEKECRIKVKVGTNYERLERGTVYLAPDDRHMGVTNEKRILISDKAPISGHRPSVDFLMNSVAPVYQEACIGVLLTGMGRDGANGLMAIKTHGGHTIGQDEKSCVIFGMPKAAMDLGATNKICSLEEIPSEIVNWTKR
ncbi:MAG: chemotaxis-specific protein-glutamate methyltransferase CheB [Nitrospiria bacterium]